VTADPVLDSVIHTAGLDPVRIRNSVTYLVVTAMTVPVVLTGVPLIHGHSGVGAARCSGGRLCAAARSWRLGACSGMSAMVCSYSLSFAWPCHKRNMSKLQTFDRQYIYKFVVIC
jgi:hypothetical protein